MFTKNIKDTFTASLLNAVSGILGEAKHSDECGCSACEKAETGKLGKKLNKELEAKEKKEPNDVKEAIDADLEDELKATRQTKKSVENAKGKWKSVSYKTPDGKWASKDVKEEKDINDAFDQTDTLEEGTMRLSKVHIVHHHDHPAAKEFAKNYTAALKGDHRDGGPTTADDKAADTFHSRYSGVKTRDGFAGSGTHVYTDHKTGAKWKVDRHPNGKTFYGTDHIISHHTDSVHEETGLDESKKVGDTVRYSKGNKKYNATVTKVEHKNGDHYYHLNNAGRVYHSDLDEAVEQVDELSKGTMGRYINKAATKMGSQGVTAGLKIAADEKSSKNFKDMGKREKGIKLAVNKLTKEEQDFIDSLNDADIEQIDEISKGAALKYLSANKKSDAAAQEKGDYSKSVKRMRGTDMAVRKYTAKPGSKSVRVPATEEVELDEARGRPKKAGGKDFTIHPKTKEKLMHSNPEHMARIEKLQKTGVLQKPKTEAGQHIITQLQKAKTSMQGGSTVHFTHGDSTHVPGTHAAKLLSKYAGMKPDEKEAFQKKIGHSHANLKSEL